MIFDDPAELYERQSPQFSSAQPHSIADVMVPVPLGTGPEVPASAGRFQTGMCVLKISDMAKMDPRAADVALAVWNGCVQDARRHARQ